MDNQTKQLIGFAAAVAVAAAVLLFLSNKGAYQLYPTSGDQTIPPTKEQMEISNVSRSLAEILPGFLGVPLGDIAVVPGESGWKAIVFGVSDSVQKDKIREAAEDFSKKNPDIGAIELVFDVPPQI